MNKLVWIVCICTFIFVTVFVISLDNSSNIRRVKFTNQNFELKNEANEFVNDTQNVKTLNLKGAKIETQNINTQDSELNVKNYDSEYNNAKNVSVENNGKIDYKNLDDSQYDMALKNAKNINYTNTEYGEFNPKYKSNQNFDEYDYKNIDWGRWKSNFVNRILDDSVAIKELDSYPDGSFFYYSFIVDNEGRIMNISVRSMHLSPSDKQKVARLIKSYEHTPITRFPQNSKRKTARVSAVMMLSNEATIHSKPSDFQDTETYKYKIER